MKRLYTYLILLAVYCTVCLPLYYYMQDGEVTTAQWVFRILADIPFLILLDFSFTYIVKQIKKKRAANQQGNKSPEQMQTD